MTEIKWKKFFSLTLISLLAMSQVACQVVYRPEDHVPQFTYEDCTLKLTWWGNDERTAAYIDVVNSFMDEYPGITVEYEYGSNFSEWTQKIADDFANGTEADINQINWNWINQLDEDGNNFLDLEQTEGIVDLNQFDSSILATCQNSYHKQVAIPVAVTGRLIFWDKTSFDEVGIDVPKSYKDLLNAGLKFKEYNNDYYPLVLSEYDRIIFMVYYLESKYGTDWAIDGQLAYNGYQISEGTAMLKELENYHVIPTLEELYKTENEIDLCTDPRWVNGEFGGIFDWDSSCGKFQSTLSEGRKFIVSDAFTDIGDYHGGFTKVSFCMSISKNTAHPREAALLLNYITNSKAASERFGSTRGVPASATALYYAVNSKILDQTSLHANSQAIMRLKNNLDPLFESSDLRDKDTGIYNIAMKKLSLGEFTPQEAGQYLYRELFFYYKSQNH